MNFSVRNSGKFIYYHTGHSPGATALSHCPISEILLSYILNQLSTSSASALHGTQTRDDRLFHALTYITEHYTKDLSLPEVAAQIGLHPQYFSKYFREHMGLTLDGIHQPAAHWQFPAAYYEYGPLSAGYTPFPVDSTVTKTYNTAFKKLFHTTPYAWQKEQKLLHSRQRTPEETSSTTILFPGLLDRKNRTISAGHRQKMTVSPWS